MAAQIGTIQIPAMLLLLNCAPLGEKRGNKRERGQMFVLFQMNELHTHTHTHNDRPFFEDGG